MKPPVQEAQLACSIVAAADHMQCTVTNVQ